MTVKDIKRFPKLYKKTSTGATQEWSVAVFDNDGKGAIVSYYGQVGGKIQESTQWVNEGKNGGKKNETTPISQALMDAESDWTRHLKKGYVQNIDDAKAGVVDDIIEGGIFPILAHKFSEQGHKIKYPALAQPKLDGHRCTSQNKDENGVDTSTLPIMGRVFTTSLWSRTRKPIKSVPHIIEAIEKSFIDSKLDGELYNHDYHANFEDLSSFIRQEEPIEGCEVVQFHVYDIPHSTMTNKERNEVLQSLIPVFEGTPIHIVETLVVNDEDELMDAFEHFLSLGYEGAIVRNMDGLYVNKRSYDLQKIKEFDDAEFKIIAIKVGTKGSMAGKAVFTCEIKEGDTFDAKMKGSLDELKKYADDPSLVLGKIVTVKYQGYTKYGKPRFPVALRFREDI